MKQTVNFNDFVDAFEAHGRENNFTFEGKHALFDYLEQCEDGMREEIELDVIALCCEYSEYNNLAEFQADYSDDYQTIEDIEKQTTVIKVGDEGFIIVAF